MNRMVGSDASITRDCFRAASRTEQLAMAQQDFIQHKGSS